MKNVKYFIFLIVAWCIGISNIERVGNLAEVHAAQQTPKDAYDNARTVLRQLQEEQNVAIATVQTAIDNLLKAIVPGQANVSTTSGSLDKLQAGLESAIAAYELLDALDWDASQVVRFILSPSRNRFGNKTRNSVNRQLSLHSKKLVSVVRGTFVRHISKHWLTSLEGFNPSAHSRQSGFVFAPSASSTENLAQYAIDLFIDSNVNKQTLDWRYELQTYENVLCLGFKPEPKISSIASQVRMPAFAFETYYCSFSNKAGCSMLKEHICDDDKIETLLSRQNQPYSVKRLSQEQYNVAFFVRLAHSLNVLEDDGRFGSFYLTN